MTAMALQVFVSSFDGCGQEEEEEEIVGVQWNPSLWNPMASDVGTRKASTRAGRCVYVCFGAEGEQQVFKRRTGYVHRRASARARLTLGLTTWPRPPRVSFAPAKLPVSNAATFFSSNMEKSGQVYIYIIYERAPPAEP